MERFFCYGKKDFCFSECSDCDECEFQNGTGGVEEDLLIEVIHGVFGGDYDLDRIRELVEADRAGRCVVLRFKPDTFVYRAWSGCGDRRPPFVTAHYLDCKDACIEAELWRNAYESDEAAEAALKGEQDERIHREENP